MPDATLGLLRRSSADHIAVLGGLEVGEPDAVLDHAVNRDGVEEYRVIVADGILKVYDNDTGAERTVIMQPGAEGYLDGLDGFRAVTAGDVTYIVNRNKIVQKGTRTSPAARYEAIVYFRQTDYSTKYTLTLDSTNVVYQTPDGSNSALEGIKTDLAAQQLAALIDSATGFQYNARVIGSSIYLTKRDGSDFTVNVSDGVADRGLRVVKGQVQRFEDLPFRAVEGMVVLVAGDAGTAKDDFYVVFSADNGESGNGLWRECPKPGVLLDLNPFTMPHILWRNGPTLETLTVAPQPSLIWADVNDDVIVGSVATGPYPFGSIVNTDGRGGRILVGSLSPNPSSIRLKVSLDATNLVGPASMQIAAGYRITAGGSQTDVPVKYRGSTVDFITVPAGSTFSEFIEIDLTGVGARPLPSTAQIIVYAIGSDAFSAPGGAGATYLSTWTYALSDITIPAAGEGVITLEPATVYPAGYVVQVRDRSDDSLYTSYTLPTDQTGTAFAVLLAAHIDAIGGGVGISATVIAPGQVRLFDPPNSYRVIGSLPTGRVKIIDTSGSGAPAFVGKLLVNQTTGASGTISAYVAPYLTVTLTGSTRNTVAFGDDIAIFETGDYFVFGPNKWAPRGAGDDVTNPFPSFVDRRIAAAFVFQNRLGFLCEDRVICSEADSYGNFFKVSAVALLDSDVVDVQSSLPEIAYFSAATPIRGLLYLASDNGVHVLEGEPFTPTSANLRRITAQPCSRNCEPVAAGDFLFFASGSEGFTTVAMLRVRDANQPALTELLTLKIPQYLAGHPIRLVAAPNLRRVFLLTDDQDAVYVFAYAEAANGDLAQAAWSRWLFPDPVKSIDVLQNTLGVVMLHGDNTLSLNRVSLERQPYN